jgi:hypothetical protein
MLKTDPYRSNCLYTLRVHVYGEYLANEHEYEIVHGACVHEYVAHEMFQNARVDDAYHYDCVNECGLSFYEGADVHVFH